MAGFGRVALIGEYYNQEIVNVFWYRSTEWLPGQGNPFDDVLAFVDAVITKVKGLLLQCIPPDYTLRRAEGVGYDDTFNIVTSSPLIRTINEAGTSAYTTGMGAAPCCILGLRLGPQVQINGIGTSKRNRGYLAIGPVGEAGVDNYSHLVVNQFNLVGLLGAAVDDDLTIVAPAVTLHPIRIHQKFMGIAGSRVLLWRTYSDVLGYRVNAVGSFRKSRQPEA